MADRRLTARLRPRSLRARQLLAASIGLLAFLALAGYALDRAFIDVASEGQRERLRNYVYAYAGDIEFLRSGDIYPSESQPDDRFLRPGSGLYAEVVLPSGDSWRSPSASGPQLPEATMLSAREEKFDGPLPMVRSDGTPGEAYRYGLGLVWSPDGRSDTEFAYTIYVMEDAGIVPRQVRIFRAALWVNLGVAGVILLLLQGLIVRWSLWPLRRVEHELVRVQRGLSDRMGMQHPHELQPLTESINALIDSEREHLTRQRNTMSDLAHSLKTPLAVLRSRLDAGSGDAELREEVETQLQRMNDLVTYQLARAASSGHQLFSAPIEIEPSAEQIVRGLEKIYAAKGAVCEFEIDPSARFHGEQGDLQELLGNLLENAFKWAKGRVLLTVRPGETAPNRRPGLVLVVEDDGPGIPADRVASILQRGVRGDERVQGHGIGLSIVQDIVHSYRGELHVGRSEELGGACFSVRLPPGF
ncbi:ATPase [Luteimonas sp. 9C]|uniref:ATP-binding protein n=1 Tax=Luteimonas sp. 9C TaxID=2653148 RepID=UPI0012F38C7A|nr:ATP-binding protein [Luteimonas sp. 9C]VXA92376.1 ATPase [Luteimonas sp. 9C]